MEMTYKQADNILPSIFSNLLHAKHLLNKDVCTRINENCFLCHNVMGFCFWENEVILDFIWSKRYTGQI
jgi:hypothetical protein